jgi:hypothetical protein
MSNRTGRTELVCLKCDNIDPMKTDAAKWASSSLADYPRDPLMADAVAQSKLRDARGSEVDAKRLRRV